jgi:hypothetical protein
LYDPCFEHEQTIDKRPERRMRIANFLIAAATLIGDIAHQRQANRCVCPDHRRQQFFAVSNLISASIDCGHPFAPSRSRPHVVEAFSVLVEAEQPPERQTRDEESAEWPDGQSASAIAALPRRH